MPSVSIFVDERGAWINVPELLAAIKTWKGDSYTTAQIVSAISQLVATAKATDS